MSVVLCVCNHTLVSFTCRDIIGQAGYRGVPAGNIKPSKRVFGAPPADEQHLHGAAVGITVDNPPERKARGWGERPAYTHYNTANRTILTSKGLLALYCLMSEVHLSIMLSAHQMMSLFWDCWLSRRVLMQTSQSPITRQFFGTACCWMYYDMCRHDLPDSVEKAGITCCIEDA